ncbi:unnamed protein product [Urochloa decumbens]|uniref:Uncharacterized protein n=1 Tax=Urochloa decumbens TaxID=240449 RepID=A0ABC9G797_9POAL
METTASWRVLSPASSSPPAAPQLPKRQPTFAGSTQLSGKTKFRVLCLLHGKPAPAPAPATTMTEQNAQLQRLAAALQLGAAWAAVEAPAALATVTGEEDLDILGILPPIAAFAFLYFLVFPVPADHELDEGEVVQAQVFGDVPAVHDHLPLLPRADVLGTIRQLQEVPEGPYHEVPLVQAKGGHTVVQGQIPPYRPILVLV